jgi:hypothetical protein
MRPRLIAMSAAAALVTTACSLLPKPTAVAQPKPCAAVYSVARCQALTDAVAADVGKNRGDVVGIAIVPDPVPEGMNLGAGWHILVRIALRDGSTHDRKICGGVPHEPACSDEPHLESRSSVEGGYRDIPAGSTPLPTLEPSSVKRASPIAIDTLSIPIERQGEYEIVLGEGSLPSGVWTTGSFDFAEGWPDDVALRDGKVRLGLTSLEPDGKPFENYYMHGWRPGVERVRATLTFDVLWFAPGATLEIRNVVVR